jgi:hypothetical protein
MAGSAGRAAISVQLSVATPQLRGERGATSEVVLRDCLVRNALLQHFPHSVHTQHAIIAIIWMGAYFEEMDSFTLRYVVFPRRNQRVSAAAALIPATVSNTSM